MLIFRFSLAGLLSLISASAIAGAYSSASIGDLTFTLMDLDPTDGVVAGYTLMPTVSGNGSSVGATVEDMVLGSGSHTVSNLSDQAFFPMIADVSVGNASARAAVGAGLASASGAANGLDSTYSARATTGSREGYGYGSGYGIDLLPHSVLIVSAKASASAWAGNLSCAEGNVDNDFGSCGPEGSSGAASMSLSYSYVGSSTTSASYSFFDQVLAGADVRGFYGRVQYDPIKGFFRPLTSVDGDQSHQMSRVLSAIFTNSTDLTQHASLRLDASVFGYATTAVPEPSVMSMFSAAMIGFFGLVRHRRQTLNRRG